MAETPARRRERRSSQRGATTSVKRRGSWHQNTATIFSTAEERNERIGVFVETTGEPIVGDLTIHAIISDGFLEYSYQLILQWYIEKHRILRNSVGKLVTT